MDNTLPKNRIKFFTTAYVCLFLVCGIAILTSIADKGEITGGHIIVAAFMVYSYRYRAKEVKEYNDAEEKFEKLIEKAKSGTLKWDHDKGEYV